MKTYADIQTEDRRLVILRVLQESTSYKANEFIVSTMLDNYGHSISNDRLRTDLSWLTEQGMIEVDTVRGVQIARLSARGQDVAEGRTEVPGIKRPRAGA